MKQKLILTTAIAATIMLSGCATTQSFGSKEAADDANRETRKEVIKGAAIGCGVGLLGASLGLIQQDALKACLGGAVIGGTIKGVAAYREQVAEAKALAQEANALGAKATVVTKPVEAEDGKTEGLDQLKIDLNAADVNAKGDKTKQLLGKAAKMANASKTPVVIRVEGTVAQRTFLKSEIAANLPAGTTVKVEEANATAPRLVLSPTPDVG